MADRGRRVTVEVTMLRQIEKNGLLFREVAVATILAWVEPSFGPRRVPEQSRTIQDKLANRRR